MAQTEEIAPSEQVKPTDLRDAVRPNSPEIGVNEANSKAEETATPSITAPLSKEVNEFNKPFILSSSGTTTFGEVEEDSGLKAAPIKLSLGENVKDDNGVNHGYGLLHIEAGHGDQIRTAGFASVEEFVETVARNYDTIREGSIVADNQTYLLEISDEHNNTLFIQLSRDGSYWNVNSAGIFKKKYSRRKPEVFTRPALEPDTNTDTSGVDSGQTEGVTTPAGNSPQTSEGKGSDNISNDQEKTEKVAENQSPIQGLDGYTEDEVLSLVRGDIEKKLADAGIDGVTLKGMALHGSRLRGDASEDSDLDVVVEYEGDMSEDGLFNILNDEPMEIEGVRVDVNPITRGKSGTLDQYMERSRQFDALKKAERETDTEPTEAQKEAGNYKKGHVKIDGYDVTIENPKGSVRRGTDASGKQWEQEMQNTYGYIRGTEGVDGDHIDVFFSDNPSHGDVFVVDQVNKDGSFDEHKVMYGFPDIESARKAYLSNYEDGWQGLGAITPVSKEEFKKWIDSSHRKTKPFAEYSSVKPLGDTHPDNVAIPSQRTEEAEQQPKVEIKTGEDYVSAAERIAKEQEIKATAAHFPMETTDEASAFDKGVSGMSDAELLMYMREDGKGDVNKSHHPSVYDEYDYRHGDEQLQSYDATLVRLNESGTTLEEAGEMLAGIEGDEARLATAERPRLLGQQEALRAYIEETEDRDAGSAAHPGKRFVNEQGNPVDADGNLILEEISSVDELKGEDFSNPTRNVQLPKIPERVDKAIGAGGKPLIIKKNIFEKNARDHRDLKPSQSREILKTALYTPDLYGQNQQVSRPYNYVVISTKGADGKNKLVLLEVNNGKENVEIVHWHYIRDKALETLKRQAEREGGHILILPSDNSKEAGGLSSRTLDLSSTGKGSDLFGNAQGKGKKSSPDAKIDDVGEPGGDYGVKELEEVNTRFNEELQMQIEGTLPKGHVYDMGMPGDVLLSTGFPNVPIELSSSRLSEKSSVAHHPFSIAEMTDLVKAIHKPMAVFAYGDKGKSQNVIVEIQHDGKNFVVGIHFNQERHGAVVSDIRGLYPKDNAEWLNWINQGKLLYADKEKIQTLIDQQRRTLAEVAYLDLNSIAKLVKDFENPSIDGVKNSKDTASYRIVDDPELLNELEDGEWEEAYRVMQVIDGELYPPMAAVREGDLVSPIKLGLIEQAEEHPELIIFDEDGKPQYLLNKGQGKGSIKAAYNPYWHTSRTALNDQFTSAHVRPNLVVVRTLVPKSELTSGYKAQYAKDAVGEMSWHSGSVSGQLAELSRPRRVILSRYDKPMEIVPHAEVAKMIAEQLRDTDIAIPYNVVWPQLRDELEKLGVEISDEASGTVGDDASFGKAEYVTDKMIADMNEKAKRGMPQTPEAKKTEAERLAKKFNTPINIIEDVNEITHPNAEIQEQRRRAKGWYDKVTRQVYVVLPNNRNVEDVAATVFHETVGHKGLRELIGDGNYNDFLREVYEHLKVDVRRRIVKLAEKHNWDFEKATDEYLSGLAEKGFEDFDREERSVWQWLKEKVLKAIDKFLKSLKLPKWVKLGDNELRYILWRSKERMERGREDYVDRARDIVKREELGLTDEARYNMGDAPETFKARQKRAVENRGTVMEGTEKPFKLGRLLDY